MPTYLTQPFVTQRVQDKIKISAAESAKVIIGIDSLSKSEHGITYSGMAFARNLGKIKRYCTIPEKPKNKELTIEEKQKNKELASERIFVEHLIRLVKVFRVAQERFRLNSRKYEQIIMTICGLVRLRIGTFIL